MSRYVIYAADNYWHGARGMCALFVKKEENDSWAEFDAKMAAYDVIDTYPCIAEVVLEGLDIDDDAAVQEAYADAAEYDWAIIDENGTAGQLSDEALDLLVRELGFEEFVEKYCSERR